MAGETKLGANGGITRYSAAQADSSPPPGWEGRDTVASERDAARRRDLSTRTPGLPTPKVAADVSPGEVAPAVLERQIAEKQAELNALIQTKTAGDDAPADDSDVLPGDTPVLGAQRPGDSDVGGGFVDAINDNDLGVVKAYLESHPEWANGVEGGSGEPIIEFATSDEMRDLIESYKSPKTAQITATSSMPDGPNLRKLLDENGVKYTIEGKSLTLSNDQGVINVPADLDTSSAIAADTAERVSSSDKQASRDKRAYGEDSFDDELEEIADIARSLKPDIDEADIKVFFYVINNTEISNRGGHINRFAAVKEMIESGTGIGPFYDQTIDELREEIGEGWKDSSDKSSQLGRDKQASVQTTTKGRGDMFQAVFKANAANPDESSWVLMSGDTPVFSVSAAQAYGSQLDTAYTNKRGSAEKGDETTHRQIFESADYGNQLVRTASTQGLPRLAAEVKGGRTLVSTSDKGPTAAQSDISRRQRVPGITTQQFDQSSLPITDSPDLLPDPKHTTGGAARNQSIRGSATLPTAEDAHPGGRYKNRGGSLSKEQIRNASAKNKFCPECGKKCEDGKCSECCKDNKLAAGDEKPEDIQGEVAEVEEVADKPEVDEKPEKDDKPLDVVEMVTNIVAPLVSNGDFKEDQVITELTSVFSDKDTSAAFTADLQERVTAIQSGKGDDGLGDFSEPGGLPQMTADSLDQAIQGSKGASRRAKKADEDKLFGDSGEARDEYPEIEQQRSELNPTPESVEDMMGDDELSKPLVVDILADELAPTIADDETLDVSQIVDQLTGVFSNSKETAKFRGLLQGKIKLLEKDARPDLNETDLGGGEIGEDDTEKDRKIAELQEREAYRVRVARAQELVEMMQERNMMDTVDGLIHQAAQMGVQITKQAAAEDLKPRLREKILKLAQLDDDGYQVMYDTIAAVPVLDNTPKEAAALPGTTAVFMPQDDSDLQSFPAFKGASQNDQQVVITGNPGLLKAALEAQQKRSK